MSMSEGTVVMSVSYGCESWAFNAKERKVVDTLEIKCLRKMFGVRQVDHIRNECVRERCDSMRNVTERADQGVLHGLGIWRGWMKKY